MVFFFPSWNQFDSTNCRWNLPPDAVPVFVWMPRNENFSKVMSRNLQVRLVLEILAGAENCRCQTCPGVRSEDRWWTSEEATVTQPWFSPEPQLPPHKANVVWSWITILSFLAERSFYGVTAMYSLLTVRAATEIETRVHTKNEVSAGKGFSWPQDVLICITSASKG